MIPVVRTYDGPAYRYRATIRRIIDGDTLEAVVDLGFRASLTIAVRLRGIDAPKITGQLRYAGTATPGYRAAEALLEIVAPDHLLDVADWIDERARRPLILESYRDERTFARWVCDLWTQDTGVSVADLMVAGGHAQYVE